MDALKSLLLLLPSTKYDFLFSGISIGIGLIFWLRIRNQPIHPDTAEFLHPGLINALHQKYRPCRSPRLWRWWHESVFEILTKIRKTRRIYLRGGGGSFPPSPYCDIDPHNPSYEGGNPFVQQKMAVYWLFQLYGRFFIKHPTSFRILQSIVIWCTVYTVYKTLFLLASVMIAFMAGVLLLCIFSYPFLDNGQIHSEIYGAIFLSVIFFLVTIASQNLAYNKPQLFFLAGCFLIFITIFFKITFASDSLIFLTYPFFLSFKELNFSLILGEIIALAFVFMIFAPTPYFVQLLRIINPKNILHYREKILTMQTSNHITNNKSIQNKTMGTPWFYFHFNKLFTMGLIAFSIAGLYFNWLFYQLFFNVNSFLLFWVATSLLTLKVQNKYYPAHFTPSLIPLILYGGLTSQEIIDLWMYPYSMCTSKYILLIFTTTAIIIFSVTIIWFWIRFLVLNSSSMYFILPYFMRKNLHTLQLITSPIIGDYIKKHSTPSHRVFTFGYASSIYIYAQRRASLDFLEGCLGIDPEIADSIWNNRWKFWVCRDIHKFKPKYLIDMDGRLNIVAINESTGLTYQREKTFYGCFDIFALKDDNVPARFTGPESVFELVLDTSERYERRLVYNKKLFNIPLKDLKMLGGELGEMISAWKLSVDGRGSKIMLPDK